MKLLYLDCAMGAAGDMLTAALLELMEDREKTLAELNGLEIPGVEFILEKSVKCGISGSHIRVQVHGDEEDDHHHDHDHEHHRHHHSGMEDIAHIVEHIQVSSKVREQILAVYDIIAQAESHVHGVPVSQIHFHEVGTMDAVADIAAVCYLMDKLGADAVYASPIHVGCGQVQCAHGLLPVPAPATAHILRDVPIYGGEVRGELCTPTGAALLKYFVAQFTGLPAMKTSAIGYGMGKKDFPAPNCVRAMLGTTGGQTDTVVELACNLDDMTGEAIGFAMEELMNAGALDVFTTAITMKKSRPAIKLTVLCRPEDKDAILALVFRHTTTLGIRENLLHRYTLSRTERTVQTPYGPVRQKCAEGYGVIREKYEYEDVAAIAREHQLPLSWIKDI